MGACGHMMQKCGSGDGLYFSGTNLGGAQKNLQSFGAAAVRASLCCFSVYNRDCLIPFLCIAALLRIKGLEQASNSSSYCSAIISFQQLTSVKLWQRKLEIAFAALAHLHLTWISCLHTSTCSSN